LERDGGSAACLLQGKRASTTDPSTATRCRLACKRRSRRVLREPSAHWGPKGTVGHDGATLRWRRRRCESSRGWAMCVWVRSPRQSRVW